MDPSHPIIINKPLKGMAPPTSNCQALAPNLWGLNPNQLKDPISLYSWAIFWAISGYHSHAHSQAFIQALSQALKWALRSSQGLRRACFKTTLSRVGFIETFTFEEQRTERHSILIKMNELKQTHHIVCRFSNLLFQSWKLISVIIQLVDW